GTWNTTRDSLTGRYLYAGSTWNGWTPVTSAVANQASGVGQSRLPIGLECLNLQVNFIGGGEGRYKASAPYVGDQMTLLGYIVNDASNWDLFYGKPSDFTITGLGGTIGQWRGQTDTRWFNGCNWDLYKVPDSTITVSFSTSNSYTVRNIVLLNGEVAKCNNLIISGGAANHFSIKGEAAGTLEIFGDLTINGTNGLDFDDGNTSTADGTILLRGSWNNLIGDAGFLQGNSTVQFRTAPAATIGTTANFEEFYNLQMNKSGGLTLNDSIRVTNQLTLTSGKINTNSDEVWVTNTATGAISGASASSYINGTLRRSLATTGFPLTYQFPLGNANHYENAEIRFISSNYATLTGEFLSDPSRQALTTFYEGGARFDSIARYNGNEEGYWRFTPAGGTTAEYDVSLFPIGFTYQTGSAAYSIAKRNVHVSGDWARDDNSDYTPGTAANPQRLSFNSFSEFVPVSSIIPFPVDWLSFDAIPTGQDVHLTWVTASERNNKSFTIERSLDGRHFSAIGTVPGAIHSSTTQEYSFVDWNVSATKVWYRIRQT
ncbi:MAG: hypothetical protein NZ108_08585, partial [Bacteroidia bacterium]|nr:hypothetical protein [Bacteroidia bacterium]